MRHNLEPMCTEERINLTTLSPRSPCLLSPPPPLSTDGTYQHGIWRRVMARRMSVRRLTAGGSAVGKHGRERMDPQRCGGRRSDPASSSPLAPGSAIFLALGHQIHHLPRLMQRDPAIFIVSSHKSRPDYTHRRHAVWASISPPPPLPGLTNLVASMSSMCTP